MAKPIFNCQTTRRRIGGWLILCFGFGTLAACGGEDTQATNAVENQIVATNASAAVSQERIPRPASLLPLDRAGLIRIAAAAADATAAGQPLPKDSEAIIGRSFEIRLPFGCDGPANDLSSVWAGWKFNPSKGTLSLSARSEIDGTDPWITSVANSLPFETAEGFWIRRPWTSAETCPARKAGITPEADAEQRQTLAIVQFFPPDAPRTLSRGKRPYSATIRLKDGSPEPEGGYRLVLSGRISGFADRQPVHCLNTVHTLPPICALAVQLTRVAFEDEALETLEEWRN